MARSIETRTIGHTAVHTVRATDDDANPYAIAEHADSIGDGDVIVIGRTVGVRIVSGHICAVTQDIGGFAVLDTEQEPWPKVMCGRYAGAYNVAVNVAVELSAPLMRTRPAPPPKRRATGKPAATKTVATKTAAGAQRRASSSARTSAAASHHAAAFPSAAVEPVAQRNTSSAATTGRKATPRRAVPGVQFSDGRG